MTTSTLRIAINAQIRPGSGYGGVETYLAALIHALGKLDDGNEEYRIIVHPKAQDWLSDHLGKNQRTYCGKTPLRYSFRGGNAVKVRYAKDRSKKGYFKNLIRYRLKRLCRGDWGEIPISDGYFENIGCNIVHFPYQEYVICSLPTVFNPHDLQHLHMPSFFKPQGIAHREGIYPQACRIATSIAVASEWMKNDIVRQYGIDPSKIFPIPWGAPTEAYPKPDEDKLMEIRTKYDLPEKFIYYPSMLWEHKNHIRLLKALANLRDSNKKRIYLVCSGRKTDHWNYIENAIEILNLSEQVSFIGLIPSQDLRAVYSLCTGVIVPTLFEAASGPVFEAWKEEKPAACSSVTSLPEQVGNAAYLFDPYHIESIAEAAIRLWEDAKLKSDLVNNGKERLQEFSWEKTARTYRALYRRGAGAQLKDDDMQLLGLVPEKSTEIK
jgi:glycosyltransferase involved in cell wall biosynthesis